MIWSRGGMASRIPYENTRVRLNRVHFQGIDDAHQVLGQGAFEAETLSRSRLREAQGSCVEGLAPEALEGLPPDRAQPRPAFGCDPAIDRVAQQGMADGGQMDPDLMGAAGGEPALHQAGAWPQRLHDPIMRQGR